MKLSTAKSSGGRKVLNTLLSVVLAAGLLPVTQTVAPTQAYATAVSTVKVQITDSAGQTISLGSWTYDETNKTYTDSATGKELSIVKDFTDSDNLSGEIGEESYDFTELGALVYTGINKKPDPRCLAVVTKGIMVDDIYAYAGAALTVTGDETGTEILESDDVTLNFQSTEGTHTGYDGTYSAVWGVQRYYYPAWYGSEETISSGTVTEEQQAGAIAVPSTLAITSYHAAYYGSGATTPAALIALADTEKSLRVMTGQVSGGSTTDINMGVNSTYNVSCIQFTATKTFAELGIEVPDPNVTKISNVTEFLAFADAVAAGTTYEGKTVKLTADIDLTDTTFSGIGSADAKFAGTFDGQGHSITGLAISTSADVAGLFASTTNTATIKDFTVTGTLTSTAALPSYEAKLFGIGAIVGVNRGTVSGITSNVVVTANTGFNTGGIVGFNAGAVNAYGTGSYANTILTAENGQKGVVSGCVVNAAVNGYKVCGGIAGENAGTIDSCVVLADVENVSTGGKNGTGGIAGRNGCNNTAYETGVITNCAVFGSVDSNGDKWQGGIAGFNSGDYNNAGATHSSISNCYFVGTKGTVNGYNNAIAGNDEGTINTNNYSLSTLSNTGSSESETGIKKAASWFTTTDAASALSNGARWIFAKSTDAIYTLLSAKSLTGYPVPEALATSDATVTSTTWSGEDTVVLSYVEGQTFDMGSLKLVVSYSDGLTETMPLTVSKTDAFAVADNGSTITVSAGDYSKTFTVSVVAKEVTAIALYSTSSYYSPSVTTYAPGENLDLSGLKLKVTYSNGLTDTVEFTSELPEGWTTNLTSPLTLEQSGTVLQLTYTLYDKATTYDTASVSGKEVTINVVSAPEQDDQGNYLITSVADLTWFAAQVNQRAAVISAKQMANIDLSGVKYTPIGNTSTKTFTGTYDGNGFTITYGADTTFTSTSACGLVGYLGAAGVVKNVTTAGAVTLPGSSAAIVAYMSGAGCQVTGCENDADITSTGSTVAGVVGTINGTNAQLTNCSNLGDVASSGSNIGGICANLSVNAGTISGCSNSGDISSTGTSASVAGIAATSKGTITQCVNQGDITSKFNAAGIIGAATATALTYVVSQCANKGTITSAGTAGGIVGTTYKSAYVDCYNLGAVTSTSTVSTKGAGGLLGGYTANTAGATFTNCYNAGTITSSTNEGALIGYDSKGAALTNCYYEGTADTTAWGGTKAGTTGFTYKTAAELKDVSFPASLSENYAADATGTFALNDGYPTLVFEGAPGAVSWVVPAAAGTLEVGDEFTVNVYVSGNNVAAAQETLNYNSAAVELVSVTQGAGLTGDGVSFTATDNAFSFAANTADTSDGVVVATYTFKCIAPTESVEVVLADGGKAGHAGQSINIDIMNSGAGVHWAVLAAGLDYGDVNDNGAVNIVDAQVVYDLASGKYTSAGSETLYDKFFAMDAYKTWTVSSLMCVADVNKDSAIDASDAWAIQYYAMMGDWGE